MANNRMYLVNKRTGTRIYLAKYYPSSGWYPPTDIEERLSKGFDESDFGHLSGDERLTRALTFGGPPYANASDVMCGDDWELEYEERSNGQVT